MESPAACVPHLRMRLCRSGGVVVETIQTRFERKNNWEKRDPFGLDF